MLQFRGKDENGYYECDTVMSHRAMLRCTVNGATMHILCPGAQYRAPENKSDFIRILNDTVKKYRGYGWTVQKASVEVGGKPAWECDL